MDMFFSVLLLKPTFCFLLDIKRLAKLLFFPFLGILTLNFILYFHPLISPADTPDLQYTFNFYAIFATLGFLCFFALFLMYEVQKVVFFGDKRIKNKKFYLLELERGLFKYIGRFFILIFGTFFISIGLSYFVVIFLKSFFSLEGSMYMNPMLVSLFLFPYFLIRFSMLLPSSVLNKKISFWQSWLMTGDMGFFFLLSYLFVAIFPLLLSIFLSSLFAFFQSGVFMALFNALMFLSLLLSCVTQGAFLSYAYANMDKRDQEQNV